GAAIEALSWSVLISTQAQRPDAMMPVSDKRAPSPDGSRAFFDGRAGGTVDVPTYRRSRLEAGARVPGPAIIAEDETSTFVTASFDARYGLGHPPLEGEGRRRSRRGGVMT